MNFIKRLQAENEAQAAKLATCERELIQFRAFLQSSKFTQSSDGERVDWIATGDVLRWIEETRELFFYD